MCPSFLISELRSGRLILQGYCERYMNTGHVIIVQ